MRTIADAGQLSALTRRLETVSATQARVWGTMSAHQMLVHLGDGADAVLKRQPFTVAPRPPKPLLKWFALSLPVPWPRELKSGAEPAAQVVSARDFVAHRDRAVRTLRELAAATDDGLVELHPIFGAMSRADWHRWAYLHTDHHLRQFGC